MHTFVLNSHGNLLASIIPAAQLLIVFSLYSIISNSDKVIDVLLIYVPGCFFTMLILHLGIKLSVNVTLASDEMRRVDWQTNGSVTKPERTILRSLKTLNWKIGHAFVLHRMTIPTILDQIIINHTINLLLTF